MTGGKSQQASTDTVKPTGRGRQKRKATQAESEIKETKSAAKKPRKKPSRSLPAGQVEDGNKLAEAIAVHSDKNVRKQRNKSNIKPAEPVTTDSPTDASPWDFPLSQANKFIPTFGKKKTVTKPSQSKVQADSLVENEGTDRPILKISTDANTDNTITMASNPSNVEQNENQTDLAHTESFTDQAVTKLDMDSMNKCGPQVVLIPGSSTDGTANNECQPVATSASKISDDTKPTEQENCHELLNIKNNSLQSLQTGTMKTAVTESGGKTSEVFICKSRNDSKQNVETDATVTNAIHTEKSELSASSVQSPNLDNATSMCGDQVVNNVTRDQCPSVFPEKKIAESQEREHEIPGVGHSVPSLKDLGLLAAGSMTDNEGEYLPEGGQGVFSAYVTKQTRDEDKAEISRQTSKQGQMDTLEDGMCSGQKLNTVSEKNLNSPSETHAQSLIGKNCIEENTVPSLDKDIIDKTMAVIENQCSDGNLQQKITSLVQSDGICPPAISGSTDNSAVHGKNDAVGEPDDLKLENTDGGFEGPATTSGDSPVAAALCSSIAELQDLDFPQELTDSQLCLAEEEMAAKEVQSHTERPQADQIHMQKPVKKVATPSDLVRKQKDAKATCLIRGLISDLTNLNNSLQRTRSEVEKIKRNRLQRMRAHQQAQHQGRQHPTSRPASARLY